MHPRTYAAALPLYQYNNEQQHGAGQTYEDVANAASDWSDGEDGAQQTRRHSMEGTGILDHGLSRSAQRSLTPRFAQMEVERRSTRFQLQFGDAPQERSVEAQPPREALAGAEGSMEVQEHVQWKSEGGEALADVDQYGGEAPVADGQQHLDQQQQRQWDADDGRWWDGEQLATTHEHQNQQQWDTEGNASWQWAGQEHQQVEGKQVWSGSGDWGAVQAAQQLEGEAARVPEDSSYWEQPPLPPHQQPEQALPPLPAGAPPEQEAQLATVRAELEAMSLEKAQLEKMLAAAEAHCRELQAEGEALLARASDNAAAVEEAQKVSACTVCCPRLCM